MAATRTQIYLTQEQRERLDELRESSGATLAELVRLAIDEYLERRPADPDTALAASFGAVPELSVPPRSEWEGREARLDARSAG